MPKEEAPRPVQDTFTALKQELNKKLSLHRISGHYYVYEYETVRDQERRKTIVKTYYLGIITDEGKYISREQRKLASLESKANKAGVIQDDGQFDEREAIALRNLSMNGRMSMSMLSKRIGMSVTGTRHFVKRLEEKYGIRYFAEINELKLGYQRYVAFIKFKGNMPNNEEIKKAFKTDPNTVFVAATKGRFDLMLIFYLSNDALLTYFLYKLRSTILNNYTWKIYVSVMSKYGGSTIELREPFYTSLKHKVFDKTKDRLNKSLTNNEYLLIKALSVDGNKDFRTIDQEYNLELGRANYLFYKLRQKGVIYRVTISIKPQGLKYNAIFLMQTNNYKSFNESREKWLRETIQYTHPYINKYIFMGDIAMPDGMLHIAPIFENADFNKLKEELNSINGTHSDTLIITDIILGSFLYRNFDNAYSGTYEILSKEYNIMLSERQKYD